jgi:hypothetical protein
VHDVEHGSCADCRFFRFAYPEHQAERRLRGWGACERPGQGAFPAAADRLLLRDAVLTGDRQAIRRNAIGLYRSEPGDACDYLEEVVLVLSEPL